MPSERGEVQWFMFYYFYCSSKDQTAYVDINFNVISMFQSEKAKHFLYQAKYGQFGLSEPLHALQRDARSNDLCESQTQLACDDPLTQLDGLIATQHRAQRQMKEQLESISKRFCKVRMSLNNLEQHFLCQAICTQRTPKAFIGLLIWLYCSVSR